MACHSYDSLMTADSTPPLTSADTKFAQLAGEMRTVPHPHQGSTALADALAEFGGEYQIEAAEFCYVAVRRPTATRQEVITGRTPRELLAKLRSERDGAS
jgi:hypothetical protein